MKFALGHSLSCKDLFFNFPVEKLKLTKKKCIELYPDGNKRDFAASIFTRGLQMIVDDIIENNTHFKLPGLGRTQAYLYMKRTSDEKFKKAFRNGKWRDVDFITSNFSGYTIVFEMQSEKRTPRTKLVYLSGKDRDRITEYTNQGKQY